MVEISRHATACILTALYLPGIECGGHPNRRKWPAVERLLRLSEGEAGTASAELRRAGLWLEAGILDRPGLLVRAERLVSGGRVLTSADVLYPRRWLDVLGEGAPPALWLHGDMPTAPFVSVVGTRHPDLASISFARDTAMAALKNGYSVCSGGALGCDRAAARATLAAAKSAGREDPLVEILPYGLSYSRESHAATLSLCPPLQDFTSAAAMERNALIYAIAERSLVAQARFKEGGAWHGAVDCLRRKLSPLFIPPDGSQASRALQALGARPASAVEDVFQDLKEGSFFFGGQGA